VSARPRWQLALVGALIVIGATVISAEFALRGLGYVPWERGGLPEVVPGGRLFGPHPQLGYTHLPGRFAIRLSGNYRFYVRHAPDTLRVTEPAAQRAAAGQRPEIWLLGYSFTHGWSVNDEETYAWRLQQRFPQYAFVNFGVSGYGTVHSLLQLRSALTTRRPALVVLAYASFHDVRNTYLRQRRKEAVPWRTLGPLAQPVAALDPAGKLIITMQDARLVTLPFIHDSALVNLLDNSWNRVEAARSDSRRVTRALITAMATVAQERGVPFTLAFIWERPFLDDLTSALGIRVVDMAVDLDQPGMNNEPWDPHPSAAAHALYAERLGDWLAAHPPR
jgi:hypothetical protein